MWFRGESRGVSAIDWFRFPLVLCVFIASILNGGEDSEKGPAPDYRLSLGGSVFDPLEGVPEVSPEWRSRASSAPDLFLVQCIGTIQSGWANALQRDGLEIVRYLYPFTYVVWGRAEAVTRSAALNFVRWSGPFDPAYRVLPPWRGAGSVALVMDGLLYGGADLGLALNRLKELGVQNLHFKPVGRRFLGFSCVVPGSRLARVAAIPGMYTLQPRARDGGNRGEVSCQISAGNVAEDQIAFPGYRDWLADLGLSGLGVVIANVDTGLEQDHPDLIQRVVACSGPSCGGSASSLHGTHTAGIIVADGSSNVLDSHGFLRGLGVAPGANLIEQVYLDLFEEPGGMLALMRDSHVNGALVSGNSWGAAGSPRGYDAQTMQVDMGVRDADVQKEGNQSLTYVLSIMNGFGGFQTQGTPDEAKNIISVGSTKAQTFAGGQFVDIDHISQNSAHGPALDGRNIPHLVAPGFYVDSSRDGGGHRLLLGTSMASPHVSGAAALFIEHRRRLNPEGIGSDPSPALIKAALLLSARDLAGNLDADGELLGHRFDAKQGWGRLDLRELLAPAVPVAYFDGTRIFSRSDEQWIQGATVADPELPLKVMLVWTDAPGHGLGGLTPAWNNNLDLSLNLDGLLYRGNRFGADGWSQTGGEADPAHNTEAVLLGPGSTGAFSITVTATNLNSDGIPGFGHEIDQDFAVVCYNCVPDPNFSLLTTGSGRVELCAPADAVYNLALGAIAGFDQPVTLIVGDLPAGLSAQFSGNPVAPPGQTTISLSGTQNLTPGSYHFRVEGQAGETLQTLTLTLEISDQLPAQPQLTLPGDDSFELSSPVGFQWETVPGALNHVFELALDPTFNQLVFSGTSAEEGLIPTVSYATDQLYFWRVKSVNYCGQSLYSQVFRFRTRAPPPLLLIDDDDNQPDVRPHFVQILDQMGIAYDLWDTQNSIAEPSLEDLRPYRQLLWVSGDAIDGNDPKSGPNAQSEAALAAYLDGGGCLVLSAQDYLWDMGGAGQDLPTAFMTSYLGVGDGSQSDVGHGLVLGQAIFGALGPFDLNFPFNNRGDALSPGKNGRLWFSGDQGDAGCGRQADLFRTVYLGFSLCFLNQQDRRESLAVLEAFCEFPGNRGCYNEAQVRAKLPGWPEAESLFSIMTCIHEFRLP